MAVKRSATRQAMNNLFGIDIGREGDAASVPRPSCYRGDDVRIRMEDVQIRSMEAEDVNSVIRLWRSSPGVNLSEADSPTGISSFIVRNPGLSLVALAAGEIVGAVLVGHDGRRGFLHHLAVDERVRRGGVGRSLVDSALSGLRMAGIQKCHIMVFQTNEAGVKFWSRVGFETRDELRVRSRLIPPDDAA